MKPFKLLKGTLTHDQLMFITALLLECRPSSRYRIGKRTSLSSSAYSASEHLRSYGLIEEISSGLYWLTPFGFLTLLSLDFARLRPFVLKSYKLQLLISAGYNEEEITRINLDEISYERLQERILKEKGPLNVAPPRYLLPILSKYEHFEHHGFGESFKQRIEDMRAFVSFMPYLGFPYKDWREFEGPLISDFLCLNEIITGEDLDKLPEEIKRNPEAWLICLSKDTDLRAKVLEYLRFRKWTSQEASKREDSVATIVKDSTL